MSKPRKTSKNFIYQSGKMVNDEIPFFAVSAIYVVILEK